MFRSEQRGPSRQHGAARMRSRGPAAKKSLWVLTMIALLAIVTLAVTACGSTNPAATGSTVKSTATGQAAPGNATTGQSFPGGTPPSGMPAGGPPSGMPAGGPPSGAPGAPGSATASTDTASTTTTTAAAVAVASTTTTQAPTTTSLADGQYGDGIYKAGTDIATGLYIGKAVASSAHWEVSGDANGAQYVAGADPIGQFYVKVTWGQYLHLTGAIIEKASSTAADPLAGTDLTEGTYRAGYDIEVGWYTGTVTGSLGYWQISSDANGQTLVANDYAMDSFTLKVTKGQYLTLRGVTVSLKQ
jgi:hypothetical protein